MEESAPGGIRGLERRIGRLSKARLRAQSMADWLRECLAGSEEYERADLMHRASKLEMCACWLEFRHYFTVDQVRLVAGMFCQQDKLCPACAIRRGAKLLHRQSARLVTTLTDHPEPLAALMVTSTIRNGSDLVERYNHLRKSMKQLDDRRKNSRLGLRASSAAAVALGGFSSIEIKRGEGSKGWHPHSHACWLVPAGTDPDELQANLRREWREITGDSHVVHVQPFHFVQAGLPATVENVAPDFAEVCKYALKFSTMEFADNWHAFLALKGRRLVNSFGLLFGVEVPASLLDDPLEKEDLPFIDLIYRWRENSYVRS